jgi:hypothetical protein
MENVKKFLGDRTQFYYNDIYKFSQEHPILYQLLFGDTKINPNQSNPRAPELGDLGLNTALLPKMSETFLRWFGSVSSLSKVGKLAQMGNYGMKATKYGIGAYKIGTGDAISQISDMQKNGVFGDQTTSKIYDGMNEMLASVNKINAFDIAKETGKKISPQTIANIEENVQTSFLLDTMELVFKENKMNTIGNMLFGDGTVSTTKSYIKAAIDWFT